MVSYSGVRLDDEEYEISKGSLIHFFNNKRLGKDGRVHWYMSGDAFRVAMEILEMQHAYCETEDCPNFENLPTITNLWERLIGETAPLDRNFRIEKRFKFFGPYVTKDVKENDHNRLDPLLWTLGLKQMSKGDILMGLHELGDFGMTEKEYGQVSQNSLGSFTLLDLVR